MKKAERSYIKTVCIIMSLFSLRLFAKDRERERHAIDQFSWEFMGSVSQFCKM